MYMDRLVELIRTRLQPLDPLPTTVRAQLPVIPNLRVIAFDVYGTLLTSAAGEIGLGERAEKPFLNTTRRLGLPTDLAGAVEERYHETIRSMHNRDRSSDRTVPEVEIRDVWRAVTERFLDDRTIHELERIPDFWDRIAIEHELDANPVWPMPGAVETIESLRASGYRIAIVSNAQFYTPLILTALFGKSPEQLGFTTTIWSYEIGMAKPDGGVFSRFLEDISPVPPEAVLYLGNDMRNDVSAAAAYGIRTALFAGDGRSLRLREDDPTISSIRPDAVCTDLRHVLAITQSDPDRRDS